MAGQFELNVTLSYSRHKLLKNIVNVGPNHKGAHTIYPQKHKRTNSS